MKNIDKYTQKIIQEIEKEEVSDDFTDNIMKSIITEKQSSLKTTSISTSRFIVLFLLAFLPLIFIAVFTNESTYAVSEHLIFFKNINFNFINFSKVFSENNFIKILPLTIGALILIDFLFSKKHGNFSLN